ncbi:DNA-processing protein DprA [Bartonella rochalimae]|uniref:DNA protecting protein DprA n=1 Tax=Bartonella rochalimae ATCC BAA-1498 TaxID=685782 RepID=A0A067WA16_9HYPH|nr:MULTISPECIES: DNA-processing protein DprA [Bartonella]AQX18314.1 DNA processing protein [Bartonella sp. A1379B]AQX22828.1 DNA processing protein [Bartonella sp. 11B]AQX23881.1 DNA processing protein [Bartonella sp. 114]AQX25279.1 DNA processing protein [Bartonella sp. Coyote22sub2]KEC56865.1 DNA protecting protein DprA [Bartonella rochalimae ATCC BAA-1498]
MIPQIGINKGILLTDQQRLNWLRLLRSENIGAVTFRNLIDHYKTAENALAMLPELSKNGGLRKPIRIATLDDAEKEMQQAEKQGIRFIGIGEPDYPPFLKIVEASPPLIAIKGDCSIFQKPSVGIVGSRNASAVGKKLTNQFAHFIGNAGFTIISGLARGIDSTAHQASLLTGTVAVMAGGIDHIYPPENQKLYDDILANGGAIISEMPIGWKARAIDFSRRNRIIAALSLGLLVVEAAMRSGSLITARQAVEMGRLIFAIPGSPLDPRAIGTNNLIKEGALLVTHPSDIIETLTPLTSNTTDPQLSFFEETYSIQFPQENTSPPKQITNETSLIGDDIEREAVLSALSSTPIDLDTLSIYSGVSLQKLYLLLIELDLAGKLIRHSGGYVSLST